MSCKVLETNVSGRWHNDEAIGRKAMRGCSKSLDYLKIHPRIPYLKNYYKLLAKKLCEKLRVFRPWLLKFNPFTLFFELWYCKLHQVWDLYKYYNAAWTEGEKNWLLLLLCTSEPRLLVFWGPKSLIIA